MGEKGEKGRKMARSDFRKSGEGKVTHTHTRTHTHTHTHIYIYIYIYIYIQKVKRAKRERGGEDCVYKNKVTLPKKKQKRRH